ncbi:MAG: nucleotidyl transferase AbiEii/AbiGii toxin family protein [Candidatus Paceibacterota bacterium]|jgi:hypothetical protein
MSEHILKNLKIKLKEELNNYSGTNPNIKINKIKEILQYYVLNFIYHHPEYSKWIMYGGSALRIIHGLDRMSVDLDFEVSHAITEKFLEELKKETENYFVETYGASANFLTVKTTTGRGLLLKFHIGRELHLGYSSDQIHVKIDLNHFVAHKTVTERRPINRDQLSFIILTYNMGTLMASKLAAILLRGTRGMGDVIYEEKGRDIYDLLWYMDKKIVPDFDYLIAKNVDMENLKTLFDRITIKILNNPQTDTNLKEDLTPLFLNQIYIENWIKNWRESYLKLLNEYEINTITTLESIRVNQDFYTDIFSFVYFYKTEEKRTVRIIYNISEYWIDFSDGDLPIKTNDKIMQFIKGDTKDQISDKVKQYVTLFHKKTEAYFKKTNKIILGNDIVTKFIRMTAENLNPKEQIILNKSALLSCELDDLLK